MYALRFRPKVSASDGNRLNENVNLLRSTQRAEMGGGFFMA